MLGYVAGDLERRSYPASGVVKQAARELLEVPTPVDGCRAPVDSWAATNAGYPLRLPTPDEYASDVAAIETARHERAATERAATDRKRGRPVRVAS
jgi:hypothetical protein